MGHKFYVWIEIEEYDEESDASIGEHGVLLDQGRVASFDSLEEAIAFGNQLWESGQDIEIPEPPEPDYEGMAEAQAEKDRPWYADDPMYDGSPHRGAPVWPPS